MRRRLDVVLYFDTDGDMASEPDVLIGCVRSEFQGSGVLCDGIVHELAEIVPTKAQHEAFGEAQRARAEDGNG